MARTSRVILVMAAVVAACGGTGPSLAPLPATPTATPGPADIVRAFLATAADPDRSFAMTLKGDVSASGAGASVDIRAEVDGSSYHMTNMAAGLAWETIAVGGVRWDRIGESDWSSRPEQTVPDPFLLIAPADVRYLRRDGAFHRLSAGSPAPILDWLWSGMFDDADAPMSSFEVLVEEQGVPAAADIAVAGTRRDPSGPFAINLQFAFTRWGEEFGIALPAELIPTPTPAPFVPPAGTVPASAYTGRVAFSTSWGGFAFALVVVPVDPVHADGAAWGAPSEAENFDRAEPAWSPDGRLLAYARTACELSGGPGTVCPRVIAVIDATGSQHDITTPDGPSQDGHPAWSPDGRRILFESSRGTNQDDWRPSNLYVVDADGGTPTRVDTGLGESRLPAWSPDGARIAFVGSEGGPSPADETRGLYVAAADGSAATLIAAGHSGGQGRPAWSRDDRIGWSRYDWAGRERLVVLRPDGTRLQELVEGAFQAWSPAGHAIMFVPPSGSQGVFVVRDDGAGAARLPYDDQLMSGFAWGP